ncbi:sigma-70 family RNA polymerase sigma factor [Asticcacaulis sp. EMRT-3]|uniref:RNA polymerase sigma factor n=1 Tax=Asticcacaulis sp. EMRT-3 TaxID=3040349 RepID=UPI0024AEDA06|nr:sigma-70 family RNA polymerase sigma factor [Asticcacaulis sp. EMRT-3]MDI7776498.1 sigma-70 family RNA polymerase sigma factor [Asticcacaulis sp. EMRT-3]
MSNLTDMLAKARRAVLKKGVHRQDADDLVHEAYLRVRAYEQTHEIQSREAMLVTTAVNLSFDRNRARKRSPFVDMADDLRDTADDRPPPDEIFQAQARLRKLSQGLDRLPEKTRRILLSRRLDGLSFKVIAAAEDMTVSAVEKQVARATLELMKWMNT